MKYVFHTGLHQVGIREKTRDEYVDVAKGLCMLLVVCIHTEVFGVIRMPFMFIAVPMFFFLSGFYDRSERPFKSWLGKSMRTLLLPGVTWWVIGLSYIAMLSYINRGSYTFSNTIYEPFVGNGAVWFLFALFYAKVILGVLLRLELPMWCVSAICIWGGIWAWSNKCHCASMRGLLRSHCTAWASFPTLT